MHYQKHSQSTAPATSDGILKSVRRFDTLDWIAAAFVIATPVFITYQLFWN